jgi:transposase
MYIKRNVTTKASGKQYIKYFLVEGYRDKETGKVKQKYILNLSSLPEKSILALQESLKGNTLISKAKLEDLEVLSTKQYGNIKIFSKLYDQYFGKYFTNQNYNNALRSIIINKIFDPKSKNGINNWLNEVDMGYKISNKNDLYDCLDYLELEQPKIEKRLSKQNQDKNQQNEEGNNILLYDITSTYFEGKGAEEICKYGYSRDHRSDRIQVNIGLITSKDGTPISVEIIAGNITDKQTLQSQIDKIKDKFNIKDLTFIFDRGMKSKVNLEYLQEAGYNYITALSHSELKKKAEENNNIQMSLFDKNDLASFEVDNKYYSLVHNPLKAHKDKNDRLKLIEKTEEKIKRIQELKRDYSPIQIQGKVSKIINRYKCEKYISYKIKEVKKEIEIKKEKVSKIFGQVEYNQNTAKITLDEKYDGFYMVESTNKEIKEEESVSQYKDLQLVERAFDCVKNHIEIRPVFHYKESRIKGHIFSCFMSYFLLHKFKQEVSELIKESTLDEILTQTKLIQKTCFRIDNFCFDKIVNLSQIQEQILKKFKISCCV